MKIARSWDLGIWATRKNNEPVEIGKKLASVSFESFGTAHECDGANNFRWTCPSTTPTACRLCVFAHAHNWLWETQHRYTALAWFQYCTFSSIFFPRNFVSILCQTSSTADRVRLLVSQARMTPRLIWLPSFSNKNDSLVNYMQCRCCHACSLTILSRGQIIISNGTHAILLVVVNFHVNSSSMQRSRPLDYSMTSSSWRAQWCIGHDLLNLYYSIDLLTSTKVSRYQRISLNPSCTKHGIPPG